MTKKREEIATILEKIDELREMVLSLEKDPKKTSKKLKAKRKTKQKSQGGFYAVAEGFTPGIYGEWGGINGAEQKVRGYSNATYKKLNTLEQAKQFMKYHGVKKYVTQLD